MAELLLPLAGTQAYELTPRAQRADRVIDLVRELRQRLNALSGLPITLKQAGVAPEQLNAVAELSVKDGAAYYNRKKFTPAEALKVLEKI